MIKQKCLTKATKHIKYLDGQDNNHINIILSVCDISL